ncbi:MAG: hypothetical protein VB085_01495 [Peptococcaceae bacterium]|nr:hypothetical protein [Peptococcaceae bacterium]
MTDRQGQQYTGALDAGYFDFQAAEAEAEKAGREKRREQEEKKQGKAADPGKGKAEGMSWEFSRPFFGDDGTDFDFDQADDLHQRPGGNSRDFEELHRRRN